MLVNYAADFLGVESDLSRNSINHLIQSPEEIDEQRSEDDSKAVSGNAAEVILSTQDSPSPSPERRHSVSSEELETKPGMDDEACEQLQYEDCYDQKPTQEETEHIVNNPVVDASEDHSVENVSDEKGIEEEVCYLICMLPSLIIGHC